MEQDKVEKVRQILIDTLDLAMEDVEEYRNQAEEDMPRFRLSFEVLKAAVEKMDAELLKQAIQEGQEAYVKTVW